MQPDPDEPAYDTQLFRALKAPSLSELEGDHRAVMVGPWLIRRLAPRLLALVGLPSWYGKRFTAAGTGTNLVWRSHELQETLPMNLELQASQVDGEPVIAITYPEGAPFPWPRVRDELRRLGTDRLLGVTLVDAPGFRNVATPFVLKRDVASGASSRGPVAAD